MPRRRFAITRKTIVTKVEIAAVGLAASLALIGKSSAETTRWQKVFGTESFTGLSRKNLPEDFPSTLVFAANGDFFVTGTTNSGGGKMNKGTGGVFIARFTPAGENKWLKWPHGSFHHVIPHVVAATSDGGFVFCGHMWDDEKEIQATGLRLLKFNADGEKEWDRWHPVSTICVGTHCGKQEALPLRVHQTASGDYRVALMSDFDMGDTSKHGETVVAKYRTVYLLVSLDRDGGLGSIKRLDEPLSNTGSAEFMRDSGLVTANVPGQGKTLRVVRYDSAGEKKWTVSRELPVPGFIASVGEAKNGDVVVSGWFSGEPGAVNNFILRIDADGKEIWSRPLRLSSNGLGHLAESKDGHFVGAVDSDHLELIKLKGTNGEIVWKRRFGKIRGSLRDLVATEDGGTILLADTKAFGAWYIDALLIKADANGKAGPSPSRSGTRKQKGRK